MRVGRCAGKLVAVATLYLSFAEPAHAQDRASAEELFQLGKASMARQELLKACNYFQASLTIEFAMGTLLNLAICHEQAGKIATAWSDYRDLEDRARRANPPQLDRAQFAHEHAEALRPRLSRIRIILSPAAKATNGLALKIDGVATAPELFDAGVPVDLGKRVVSAAAPDCEAWSQVVAIDDEKMKVDVTVPALKAAAAKPKPPPSDGVALADVERVSAERSQRTVGFVVGGIGVASLAAGAIFGLLASGASSDATCAQPCYNDTKELEDAKAAYRRMDAYGWVSNITLIAGAVGLGAGAYLVLTAARGEPKPSRAWTLGSHPLLGGAALTFGGTL